MKRVMLILIMGAFLLLLILYTYHYFDLQFLAQNERGLNQEDYEQPVDHYNKKVVADIDRAITVAYYNSGYLYNEKDEEGINKDIIDELSRRMGIAFDERVMPRARINSMIAEGSLPMSVSAVMTPERERYSYFIPCFAQKNHALVEADIGLSTEAELLERPDIKVGIIRGYYYGEHYAKLIEKLKEKRMIVEAIDTESLYKMLKDGWIQVTFNIASSYLYYFDALDIQNISVMDWAPDEAPLLRCLTLSKRYFIAEDAERFKTAIAEMQEDGTLCEIFHQYMPEDEAKRMCDF